MGEDTAAAMRDTVRETLSDEFKALQRSLLSIIKDASGGLGGPRQGDQGGPVLDEPALSLGAITKAKKLSKGFRPMKSFNQHFDCQEWIEISRKQGPLDRMRKDQEVTAVSKMFNRDVNKVFVSPAPGGVKTCADEASPTPDAAVEDDLVLTEVLPGQAELALDCEGEGGASKDTCGPVVRPTGVPHFTGMVPDMTGVPAVARHSMASVMVQSASVLRTQQEAIKQNLNQRNSGQMVASDHYALQDFALRVVQKPAFELVSVVMICGSAVLIGLHTDHLVRSRSLEASTPFRVADVFFLMFFICELAFRLVAFRAKYFFMAGWGWNLLDLALVLMQLLEELINVMVVDSTTNEVQISFATSMLLRIVKIARCVRLIRVFHVMRFADELRLLVTCILHSSKSFCWSSILILLTCYVFGVHLTQVTLFEMLDGQSGQTSQLVQWYGSVPRSMLSLFQALTGGVDWNDLVQPLIWEVSPWMGVVFFLFISFAILALMNVVTAQFVQHASERAAQVKTLQSICRASRLFKTLDADSSGVITLEEVEYHLNSPAVRDFFQSIDVDVSEAKLLFDMLDHDNSGAISFNEFLNGCLRLQSPAKVLDLALVMREIKELLRK